MHLPGVVPNFVIFNICYIVKDSTENVQDYARSVLLNCMGLQMHWPGFMAELVISLIVQDYPQIVKE